MSLYVQRVTDQGNKCQEWHSTKAWPCAAAGSGRGNPMSVKTPNATPLPLPGNHLQAKSNNIKALIESLLLPIELAIGTTSKPARQWQPTRLG